jgi:hypothetical protein
MRSFWVELQHLEFGLCGLISLLWKEQIDGIVYNADSGWILLFHTQCLVVEFPLIWVQILINYDSRH